MRKSTDCALKWKYLRVVAKGKRFDEAWDVKRLELELWGWELSALLLNLGGRLSGEVGIG